MHKRGTKIDRKIDDVVPIYAEYGGQDQIHHKLTKKDYQVPMELQCELAFTQIKQKSPNYSQIIAR